MKIGPHVFIGGDSHELRCTGCKYFRQEPDGTAICEHPKMETQWIGFGFSATTPDDCPVIVERKAKGAGK